MPALITGMHQNTVGEDRAGESQQKTVPKANHLLFIGHRSIPFNFINCFPEVTALAAPLLHRKEA